MILIASIAPFLAMIIAVHCAEALTRHKKIIPALNRISASAPVYTVGAMFLLFSLLGGLSGRPWHAAFVVFVLCLIVLIVSTIKKRILAEPLVVTDFYLVKQAVANPRLYYLDVLAKWWAQTALVVVLAMIITATLLWFNIEPAHNGRVILLGCVCIILATCIYFQKRLTSHANGLLNNPVLHLFKDTGLLTTLVLTGLSRINAVRPSTSALHKAHSLPRVRGEAAPLVIGLQLESFVDLQQRGLKNILPAFAAFRQESLMHGTLQVPAEGAYTMRTEAAVLTGLTEKDFGIDATDPYLALDRYTIPTLPSRFAQAGYRTIFLHPHDPRFFRRNKVMPALGFDYFLSGDDFQDSRRYGPYVCDEEIGDAIINLVYQCNEPLFIFAVTLENHGPWQKGRLEGIDDPQEQYLAHLAHTDAMLGTLHARLRTLGRPALVCAWGDHTPARTLSLDVGDRLKTDYFIWNSQSIAPSAAPMPLAADELARMILAHA